MDPPEKALVLCVDEKSQIQALDRTAPCESVRNFVRGVIVKANVAGHVG